ncbi:hypothetical protein C8R44DRAFT_825799, partial [Mycena epipterygia]
MRSRRRRARHDCYYCIGQIHLAHAILPLRHDHVRHTPRQHVLHPGRRSFPFPFFFLCLCSSPCPFPPSPPSLATTTTVPATEDAEKPGASPASPPTTTPLLRKTQRSPAPRLCTHTRIPPRLPPYLLLPRLPHPSNLLPPVQTPTPPRTSKTRTSTHRTDWPGALLPAAGLVLLVFVLGQGAGPGREVPAFGARDVPGVSPRMGMQAGRNEVNMWKVVTRAFVPPPDREFDFDDFDADEFDGEFAAFDDLGMPCEGGGGFIFSVGTGALYDCVPAFLIS